MTSINVVTAESNPRQAVPNSLNAGFFMPVENSLRCGNSAPCEGGYGVEVQNKGLITPNTHPTNLDRRKPAVAMLIEAMTAPTSCGLINKATETSMSKQLTANFHGTALTIAAHNNQPHISAKQITEAIGLDWGTQYRKLNSCRDRWSIVKMTMVGEDGKKRETVCLPLRKLPGWLMTIQPNKLSNELRPKIIQYQTECDEVLWAHWEQSTTQARIPAEQQTLPAISNQRITVVTVIENGAAVSTRTLDSEVVAIERAQLQNMLKTLRDAQYHAAHVTSLATLEIEKVIQ